MLTFVVGTRPEALKVAPVVQVCQEHGLRTTVLHTGQHTDLLLKTGLAVDQSFPHVPLSDGDVWSWVRATAERCSGYLRGFIVVQGDTMSAAAGALGARNLELPVYHIEAGIRSGNPANPWPEEALRVTIDAHAMAGACATKENQRHLGDPTRFPVTGNPGIDALLALQQPIPASQRNAHVLVTLHRRESWGEPLEQLGRTIAWLARSYPELTFLWPAHPSPAVHRAIPDDRPPNLRILAPLRHEELVGRLASAQAVITDSGGIQEEAATLGIPAVICRDVTDRPESVDSGQAVVVGRNPHRLIHGFETALTDLSREPTLLFGDGQAAPRIASHLRSLCD